MPRQRAAGGGKFRGAEGDEADEVWSGRIRSLLGT